MYIPGPEGWSGRLYINLTSLRCVKCCATAVWRDGGTLGEGELSVKYGKEGGMQGRKEVVGGLEGRLIGEQRVRMMVVREETRWRG